MVRLLHFILVSVFIVAGASPVPACYATKPNCEKKVQTTCPFSSHTLNHDDKKMSSCPLAELSDHEQQQPSIPYPAERLKRLTIDQIPLATIELPSFAPTLVTNIFIELESDSSEQNQVIDRVNCSLHPPPQLYLQHQSFLI